MTRRTPMDNISFLTVIIGVTHEGLGIAENFLEEGHKRLHETLDRWPEVRAIGRFEIDIVVPGEEVGSFKLKTLVELGFQPYHELPALLVHVHAVVVHDRPKRQWLRTKLAMVFPGTRRVDLRPLRTTRDQEESLDALVRYSLKIQAPPSTLPKGKRSNARPSNESLLLFYCRMVQTFGGLSGPLVFKQPYTY